MSLPIILTMIGIAVPVAVFPLAMMFRRRLLGRPRGAGIPGTAEVVSVAGPHSTNAAYRSCTMNLVLRAEGIQATAAVYHGLVATNVWPMPGQWLPVSIDPSNPQKFAIQWNQVVDSSTAASQAASRIASSDPQASSSDPTALRTGSGVLPRAGGDQSARALFDDPVSALERLQVLKDKGALTQSEFDEQKRRLLGM